MWLHKSGMLAVAGKVAVGKAVMCRLVVCTLAVDVAVMGQPLNWQNYPLSFHMLRQDDICTSGGCCAKS